MSMASLEVCVDSVASAEAAQAGGASRLELCDNLCEGGTTPSIGKLVCCLRRVSIPIHVMVRPRGGDFLYSAGELEVMLEDIRAIKQVGAHGIVLGVLTVQGTVDEPVLTQLIQAAAPLPVTFHRAIDVTKDLQQSLQACERCGVARILTSGGTADAFSGIGTLNALVASSTTAVITAGGGLTEHNVKELVERTGVREVHGTFREIVASSMCWRPKVPVYMGSEKVNSPETEFQTRVTQVERVQAVMSALNLVVAPEEKF